MGNLLLQFLQAILGAASELDDLDEITNMVFRMEEVLDIVGLLNSIMSVTTSVGIGLIVLKFLIKGFQVYVLWTDGDPDSSPVLLLTNFVKAMVIAICFPVLYTFMVDVAQDLYKRSVGSMAGFNLTAQLEGGLGANLFGAICGIGMSVCFLILYFGFIGKGLEMFILRAGVPIACVGLVDADGGVFRNYLMMFFKCLLTIIVQLLLLSIAASLAISIHPIVSIAAMIAAVRTPRFLAEFMVPSTGGGFSQKIYTATHIGSSIARIARKG